MILPGDENISQPESSDSEDYSNSADLKTTNFVSVSKTALPPKPPWKVRRDEGRKAPPKTGTSTLWKKTKDDGSRSVKANPREGRTTPISSRSSSNGKKKMNEEMIDTSILGRGMQTKLTGPSTKKRKPQKTYSKMRKAEPLDSIPTMSDDDESPSKSSKSGPNSTPRKNKSDKMILPNPDTPQKYNRFNVPDGLSTAVTQKRPVSPIEKKPSFIMPDEDYEEFKPMPMSKSGVIVPTMAESTTANSSQVTDDILQGLGQDVVGDARRIMAAASNNLATGDLDIDDDYFLSMTQKGRCPMCNDAVDPDDLRAFGSKDMGIKQQEKFCRSHKTKTAEQDWEGNNYPMINWTELNSRIAKHHYFIKGLIKGEDSHYRSVLGDKIEAGEDRTAMTTRTNLTPGYYGTRGLRIISENLMNRFTPLLKKRMVQDRLMSSRGFTPYVQTVLVPEVAVRLIMEDMNVDEEEAREILANSAEIGDLMNEEISDVVRKKKVVVNSDESDGSDENDHSDD